MSFPAIKGIVANQAHVGIPDGTTEEEYARGGFFGKYAHFYRTNPLVDWDSIEGPLKPRAYALSQLPPGSDFISSRKSVLENQDCKILNVRFTKPMDYCVRNADGDEIVFVHEGKGEVDTDFGPLTYRSGDYLLIPRGTIVQWKPSSASHFLIIESYGEVSFPDKGLLGQHALIDPSCIKTPHPRSFDAERLKQKTELHIKRKDQWTKVSYPFHPLNVVGWKGTLSVMQFNVEDIRPVSSERYHLPPTAHATLVAKNLVICTFLPRPLETGDPLAMKVPFYHLNIDYDEVLFYHSGQFFSRAGIEPGMLTFHPQGIEHGPQKNAVERTAKATRTNEVAVMIDTVNPLEPTSDARNVEQTNYINSWK